MHDEKMNEVNKSNMLKSQTKAETKTDMTELETENLVIQNSKFPKDVEFDFDKFNQALQEGWEKDDNKPKEIPLASRNDDLKFI